MLMALRRTVCAGRLPVTICRNASADSTAGSPVSAKTTSNSPDNKVPAKLRSIAHELSIASELPIERRSLSRGLTMNKFEKDFMIYPEYQETEDLEYMKTCLGKLARELDEALDAIPKEAGKATVLSDGVLQALLENKAFSMMVSRDFGGTGACQKDLMLMSEVLGGRGMFVEHWLDLSLFTMYNHYQSAATLIALFGSEEQKCRYLPKLTTFDCRPAICISDEGSPKPPAEVILVPGDCARLNGTKVDVCNADVADVFIVFAKQRQGDIMVDKCLIVDRADLTPAEKITVTERIETQGLNGTHMSKVNFSNVRIKEENALGDDIENAEGIVKELTHGNRIFYGAGVVGFLKKLIAQLCDYATTQIVGDMRLSDSHPAQTTITDLSVGTFVLESMVYYIGGLVDEELYLMNDVEGAIIQRYANKVLRQAITTVSDVAGLAAAKVDFPYEKLIRDIVTLVSMTEPDMDLVRSIVLPSLDSFVAARGSLPNLMERATIVKLLVGDLRPEGDFKDPKLSHFIAEHVHPSLELPARNLEQTMSRVSWAIDRILTDKGILVKQDYYTLKELATVMENNLGMVAAIARTSRSYSIGLRNTDLEATKQSENILQELMNFYGIMRINPSLTALGKTVLDQRGYHLEHPTERNW